LATGDTTRGDSGIPDAKLVAAVLAGAHERYNELVRRYKSLVTTYAFSRVNQRELAEDLAQETFVRAYVALEHLKNPAAFSAWLLSIAHNVCIDHLRTKSRTVSLEGNAEKDSQGQIVLESRRDRPVVERLADEELRDHILAAIDSLGDEYRATLLLRHVSGLSCEQIAETLGVSLGTVTSRLSRAHRLLRERLDWLVHPPEEGHSKTH
jgi:RNA polymerase sigma-70 factor (ECF subfamily)